MKKSIIILIVGIIALSFLFSDRRKSEEHNPSALSNSPHGRSEWRQMMRSHDADPHKVMKARDALKKQYLKQSKWKDAGLNKWTELNNHEEGGRVRAIAVHPTDPDILYAGGVSGGIWKSTNQGQSWTALNDFLPSLSVTSIIVHPDHPDTIYAATGEGITGRLTSSASSPGAGIFRSVNGGDSWELVEALQGNQFDNFFWVNKIAFDPADPSKFYATKSGFSQSSPNGGCGQLYLFTNHGQLKTSQFVDCGSQTTSVYINPNDPENIFLCHIDGLQVKTAGHTWNLLNASDPGWLTNSGRVEVAMSASNANIVYALCEGESTGYLLKSVNKGETWTTVISGLSIFTTSGNNQGSYDNVIWVDPDNVDNLIIGGIDLWRSTNGGVTFIKISDFEENDNGLSAHGDHHIIIEASDYSTSNKKLYFGNDGGVARADNWSTVSQITGWNLLNNGLHITQFYSSDIDGPTPQRIIAGAQDNGTLYSDNSGASWTKPTAGDGGYCAFSRQDPELIYTSSQNGAFYVKCNQIPWSGAFAPYFFLLNYDSHPPFIAPMVMMPDDEKNIVVGGNGLYFITFEPANCIGSVLPIAPQPIDTLVTVSALDVSDDGSKLFVGYSNGKVYRADITPSSILWYQIYSGFKTISAIKVHHTNYNKVAIALGGYDDDNILISTNADELLLANVIWNSRSNGMPAIHVNTLAWHPENNNWIYAGTDMGIMASEDNGTNWNVTPNFMGKSDGPAFVEVTKLQFTTGSTFGGHQLVATTYGRGMWKTSSNIFTDVYVDEDHFSPTHTGRSDAPFLNISDAENIQAHGQTWHIDGGVYPVDTAANILLKKRLGELMLTGSGPVIIGEN